MAEETGSGKGGKGGRPSTTSSPPTLDSIKFDDYDFSTLVAFKDKLNAFIKDKRPSIVAQVREEVDKIYAKFGLKVKKKPDKGAVYEDKVTGKTWDTRTPFYTPAWVMKADQNGTLIDPATREKKSLDEAHKDRKPKKKQDQ